MAYQYYAFDDVLLPIASPSADMSTGESDSTLTDSINGAYDHYGARRRFPKKMSHSMSGYYYGDWEYIVDEDGIFLVDEDGYYAVGNDPSVSLRAQVDALTGKVGVQGTLYRQRLDYLTLEWKTARLMSVGHQRQVRDRRHLANVSPVWETTMIGWRAPTASTPAVTLTAGIATALIAYNGGEVPIEDAILSIAPTSGGITGVTVSCEATGVSWSVVKVIASGESLVVECDPILPRVRVLQAGGTYAIAYNEFALGVGHSAYSWLPLDKGNNTIIVTVTGGPATATLTYYNQWY